MAVLCAQVVREVGKRRGNAHVVQPAQPAERQREHEVVSFVQLSGGAVALRVDAQRDGTAQHAVAHERVSPVANAKVGVRVDVRHMERRSQPSFPNQVAPVKQRAVVRRKHPSRDGTRAVQVEMILQKCAHLRFRPRLGGIFRRAFTLRREGAGIGQEEIKINVEYPRHRAFLRCIKNQNGQGWCALSAPSLPSVSVPFACAYAGRPDAGILRVVLRREGAGMMRVISTVPAVRQCSFCLCVCRTA